MDDPYARIMARPPGGTCDICKARPATTWFGQTSVAHCGVQACVEVCHQQARETQARIERERQEPEDDS